MTDHNEQIRLGGVTPHLTITGGRAAEAIAFYERAFSATPVMPLLSGDGDRIIHARLRINGALLMLADDFPEHFGRKTAPPSGVAIHLQVDDADRWFEQAIVAGADVLMPLADMFWGDRYGEVSDPFGHSWSIGASTDGRTQEGDR